MSAAKGFAPFPAQRGRSTRGRSWWARAWVQAMEDTSLDNGQLKKGRRFANSGQVGTITVSPGRIAALVEAPEDRYESAVMVEQLSRTSGAGSSIRWGRGPVISRRCWTGTCRTIW